ncbi:hypothetical protein ITJ55_08035 [Frigoribacterium sp. VKM Ac-1396]|uniref:hypothetical protein n=1 Tax=Frigoribacterium sp. VKM Ac-1396 TaxID=2783821 RepID=UPI00188B41BC|nr:hypothetical protein [Frigoribacterium sp. VKM Ac-1396]MBF4600757.1 hypothetical protein [Frigoribacterium sp. VKM Ac-1396]
MSRPWDWSPLDLAADPVPGDPTEIRSSAVAARATGTSIETQSRRLRRLAKADGWDSESGRTFTTSAEPLADAIDRAKQRYLDLAAALDTYADGLDDLQRQADRARLDADDAKEARRTADRFVVPGETDPVEVERQEAARTRAVDLADADLADAKAVITRLVGSGGDASGEYGALNDRAIAAIRLAGDDELRDTWWDGVKQVVHDAQGALNITKDVLSVLGFVLGLAAMFAGPLAPLLLGLSIAVAALSLLITLAQAVAGDATPADVLGDIANLGMACVGLGGLRAVSRAVTATKTSVTHSGAAVRANAAAPKHANAVRAQARRELSARADAIGRNPTVRFVDELVGGGGLELFLVRRLARGGPSATAHYGPGMLWAGISGPVGLVGHVGDVVTVKTIVSDLADGSYRQKRREPVVGSL